jgi:hypothetical protein
MAASLLQTSPALRTQESGSTSSLAFGAPVSAGSKLILYVGNYPAGIASVSDNRGNTWARAVGWGDDGDNYVEIWYSDNAAAGPTTVTITPATSSGNYITAIAQEWAGVATGAPQTTGAVSLDHGVSLDVLVTGSGTADAGSLVCTAAIAEAGSSNFGWSGPTPGYSLALRENDTNNFSGVQAGYLVLPSAGVPEATHTSGDYYGKDAIIASWPEAAGACGGSGAARRRTAGRGIRPSCGRTRRRCSGPCRHCPAGVTHQSRVCHGGQRCGVHRRTGA